MSEYLGDINLDTTIDHKVTTRQFSSGAPFAWAGSPAVAAYPDNSTTEITAGITLTNDFDGVTGLHNIRVVATSGNGYASGVNYSLVVTSGTVDGVSIVGEVIATFSIEARSTLSAAEVRSEVDDAIAAGTLSAEELRSEMDDAIVAGTLSAEELQSEVRDLIVELEGNYTLQQALSIILSAVAGRTENGGFTFKTPNNEATRIVSTADINQNRTAVTLTPSGTS